MISRIFLSLSLFIGFQLFAQGPVRIDVQTEPEAAGPGGSGEVLVRVSVDEGFHISDASEGLFSVKVRPPAGLRFIKPEYPKGIMTDEWGSVYRNRTEIILPFSIDADFRVGEYTVPVEVLSQPCDEKKNICYPPETKTVEARLSVLAGVESGRKENAGISGRVTRALESGSWTAFLLIFLGGLATSLTPCVYPMIPITIAVIGAQATGGRLKGFILSLFYVLGMSLTFSLLGVLAAKTGSLFGSYMQHPAVNGLFAALFFLMGLSLLGAFVVQLPAGLRMKMQGKRRRGFSGALLTGIAAGLLVSPCVSPLLVVILSWVARTGSAVLGFGLLFTFAWGIGVLFIVLGTFSGILKNLPRTGGWTEYIERIFGLLLLLLSFRFLKTAVSPEIFQFIWGGFCIVFAVFMGAFEPLKQGSSKRQQVFKAAGLIAAIAGAVFIVRSLVTVPEIRETRQSAESEKFMAGIWLSSEAEALSRAGQEDKPVLLDFFAEWCAACRELDEKTWPDPAVEAELGAFIPVKLDLTRSGEREKALQKKYGVIGMPTVIVLSPDGKEKGRFEGFQDAETVSRFLREKAGVQE
ncbi:thioredoxin family protein [bacterium]|nr:thioredoxin family protein [bacterium]